MFRIDINQYGLCVIYIYNMVGINNKRFTNFIKSIWILASAMRDWLRFFAVVAIATAAPPSSPLVFIRLCSLVRSAIVCVCVCVCVCVLVAP